MRGMIVFSLIVFASIPLSAGEDQSVVSNIGRERDVPKKQSVLTPQVSETYEYQDVCGCCEKDIQCDMKQKAIRWNDGNTYDSITKWKVKWDYGYYRDSHSCSADSFRVTLDIVIHLPRWVCTGDAPRSLTKKWDAYINNLKMHENGHRDITVQAARELTRAVSEMSPARSCRELDRALDALCQEHMEKLDDAQRDYDEATGHGFAKKQSFP